MFINRTTERDPQLSFTFLAPLTVDGHVASIAAGDLDSDGWPDLAVASGNPGVVTVFLGTGNPQMPMRPQLTICSSGAKDQRVAIGDANGDGRLNLIVSDGNGAVRVYLQAPAA